MESFDELNDTVTYLEHIWVNIPKRSVKILDTEGYEEKVTWKFDTEGMEGFMETLSTFQDLPKDLITYL
tara:strand:- start:1080 stop:1286 length:207 start_codon:yes stop_codon:yes gene_type:complete